MRIVRLRTSKPNTFWFLDNIHLTPFEETSPPFDLDKVYSEGQKYIKQSVRITGRVEIIDASNTREELIDIIPKNEPIFELPGQNYMYMPRPVAIALDDNEVLQGEVAEEEDVGKIPEPLKETAPPSALGTMDIPQEYHKKALKLLAKKVGFIEDTISGLSKTVDTRLFILACLRAEEKRKNRKSIIKFLEERFLMIPPE